jgi:hypothetical protein
MSDRKPVPSALKATPRSVMKPPPGGAVPHPRRPRLVPDIGGNELMDLFAFFPDLPRPARPLPRFPKRRLADRRLRRYERPVR